ncbi:MAG: tetratricopeptide repeat protein [Campylobacterota bacterium]|nr:tetratricopeptide repeat protein [Campylobacterota bacterium]
MTVFQLLMLGASAYFAFKIYEHIQTLQDPEGKDNHNSSVNNHVNNNVQTIDAFSPFDADELIQKADVAFEEEDYKKALAFLLEANNKASNNPDTLFKIGYILQKQNDNDEALSYYKQALEFDKKNEYIHNSLASIYRENREYISAQMHLRDSLALDNTNPITYYNYGNLLVDMDNSEEAINMYEKAIEINPDFEEAKVELETLRNI